MSAGRRNPRIDTLRGVSILLVLLHHFNIAYVLRDTAIGDIFGWAAVHAAARNGNYGVTVFFVISGYLITSNALRRWGSLGAIDVRTFYVSRIARIMPCLLLVLALVNGLAAADVPIFRNHAPLGVQVSFWLVNLASLTFWMNVLIGKYGWAITRSAYCGPCRSKSCSTCRFHCYASRCAAKCDCSRSGPWSSQSALYIERRIRATKADFSTRTLHASTESRSAAYGTPG